MDVLEQLAAALGDRYRVERKLGEGGMATVFLAEDLKHRRRVAVKLLKPELSAVLGGERFLREIEIAATLQHPHILPLYDSGQSGSLLYYVMPFVEGESLRQRLDREQQLPIGDALRIAREVGSALQYAHDHGVVHRDVKPENILLSGGQAVVTDFGIARAVGAAGAEALTQTGMVVGTPRYMSPEQSGGMPVGGRSDQYSLACTLYEMLVGQPPFTGPSAQAIMARHSLDPVPGLRVVRGTVPDSTERAIMRAMAKLPADRFLSVQEFVDALEAPGPALTHAVAPNPAPAPRRMSRPLAAGIGLAVLVLAAAAVWLAAGRTADGRGAGARRIGAIAVLPLTDLAGNPDTSYLGEGITDGLIADLAQIGSLKVISRSSGALAEGTARPLARIARQLGVEAVVKGTLAQAGDTVRVSLQFFDAPDGSVRWTRDYQGRLGQVPELQREMALAIAGAVDAEVKEAERGRLGARREVDQRAYESYLRGRFHLERGELEPARTFFERAQSIAPVWAPPYVGLANYYTALPFYTDVPPVDVLPKARAALVHAIELDDGLAEAHSAIAYIRAYYEWDWRAAEQEFKRALELRPSYADAYFSYSRFLASRGRLDEAIAQIGRAVELDPLSLQLQSNRALLNYFAGRYDTARAGLREILKADSSDVLARWGLALVAEQQGRSDEAIALLEPISGASLNRKSSLGHAYAIAGRAAQARGVLDTLRARAARSYVPSYYLALVHAGLGERDAALRYLERAYQERSTVLAYLRIDPRLAPLRDDPRFLALVRHMGGD
ncbi:MAG: protein kinase domain-containing protein [Deltaproteobacteria bacterium]